MSDVACMVKVYIKLALISEIWKGEMPSTNILYIVHENGFRDGIDLRNGEKCSAYLP
jgi:hypothetical protein